MPSRNVYVSADDVELFDRAASLAGGLAPAVARGLRLYIDERERHERTQGMREIEVDVKAGDITVTKRFTGRRLLRYDDRDGRRVVSYRVYVTAQGRLAVHRRDDADWAAVAVRSDDDPAWSEASSNDADWWAAGAQSLDVFDDTAAMGGAVPDRVVAATERALAGPQVDVLDI